jgi:hypothetical protein
VLRPSAEQSPEVQSPVVQPSVVQSSEARSSVVQSSLVQSSEGPPPEDVDNVTKGWTTAITYSVCDR